MVAKNLDMLIAIRALSYNGMKMNRDEGRVLGANKIILPADGHIDIARMVENLIFHAGNGQD